MVTSWRGQMMSGGGDLKSTHQIHVHYCQLSKHRVIGTISFILNNFDHCCVHLCMLRCIELSPLVLSPLVLWRDRSPSVTQNIYEYLILYIWYLLLLLLLLCICYYNLLILSWYSIDFYLTIFIVLFLYDTIGLLLRKIIWDLDQKLYKSNVHHGMPKRTRMAKQSNTDIRKRQ